MIVLNLNNATHYHLQMNFLGICTLPVQSIVNYKKTLVFPNKLTISKKHPFRVRRVIGDIMEKNRGIQTRTYNRLSDCGRSVGLR